ncbi:metallophosphoesterase [Sphingoaurantiacus capsulatus]|uniref:Metallophosphoesterase n=1 Tax=Sphingoaurantiacus capsulatus TaxID=1771310 RepID=A0ABV7XEX7_9SPHN
MLKALLQQFWPSAGKREYALPAGVRVYAIGDIHGRLDKLRDMETQIAAHLAAHGAAPETFVVLLGDYVDRGPESRSVIDHLLGGNFAGLPTRRLLGNHEAALLTFLDDPSIGPAWLAYGGMATLASYGVSLPSVPVDDRMEYLRQALIAQLPPAHLEFLQSLELTVQVGDYLFVHAGVRPGRTLEQQSRSDLLEIREPFLGHRRPLPWRVVHGHTVSDAAEVLPSRIGLDTGAYASGRLTAAVIEGASVEILVA